MPLAEAFSRYGAHLPQIKVLILSMHNDEPYVIEALRASKLTCMVAGAAALATLFLWGTTAAGWLQAFAKGTSGGGAVLLAALSYFSVINGGTTAAIVATCLS